MSGEEGGSARFAWTPGSPDLAEADAAIARGDTVGIEEIKAELKERLRAEEETDRKRRAG
jgi:hypothetical protein